MTIFGFKFYWFEKYWRFYVWGLELTLQLALATVGLAIVFGILIGLLRLSHNRLLSGIAAGWVNFIRGIPVMLQVYIVYYGLSFPIPDFWAAVIALTINSSAYISETVRAGIQAVDRGQMEAARCVGMRYGQAMWHIVIPQAIKNILPALCNEFILLIKNTSIVSVIGLHELTYRTNAIRSNTYLAFEPLIVSAIIYFVVTYVLKKLVGILERRLQASD